MNVSMVKGIFILTISLMVMIIGVYLCVAYVIVDTVANPEESAKAIGHTTKELRDAFNAGFGDTTKTQ